LQEKNSKKMRKFYTKTVSVYNIKTYSSKKMQKKATEAAFFSGANDEKNEIPN